MHTLKDIAGIVREGHIARITLSVHSAAAGWDEHSQELSERRAAAIRAVLVKDGVADAKITTVTVGRDPLVPAMDGVRSPENRRTDIILY